MICPKCSMIFSGNECPICKPVPQKDCEHLIVEVVEVFPQPQKPSVSEIRFQMAFLLVGPDLILYQIFAPDGYSQVREVRQGDKEWSGIKALAREVRSLV